MAFILAAAVKTTLGQGKCGHDAYSVHCWTECVPWNNAKCYAGRTSWGSARKGCSSVGNYMRACCINERACQWVQRTENGRCSGNDYPVVAFSNEGFCDYAWDKTARTTKKWVNFPGFGSFQVEITEDYCCLPRLTTDLV